LEKRRRQEGATMMYISTRGNYPKSMAAEVIKLGMVPGGGLFVPEMVPRLKSDEINAMAGLTYNEIAQKIFEMYLSDFSSKEISEIVGQSYNQLNFSHEDITPVKKVGENFYILELWHGPTAAFKDMALQIMPRFLSQAVRKIGSHKEIVILVATSGDTGKAALEGFKDVPGIKIIVFYPFGGVSKVQELQMNTTEGNNTFVVAVKGNFDDCQTAVKEIFADRQFKKVLDDHNMELSSANSINWGRLLPQIVYYFRAYADLLKKGAISKNEKINIVVPTGNFGNILAGYYAFLMGLPVYKFICASNENKVLTDVINTGVYDRRREFLKTKSPSMDILISSNFERFLFEVNGHNAERIKEWFSQLESKGYFSVDGATRENWQEILVGDFATEEETLITIKEVYEETGYLLDTHTAVGVKVYEKYAHKTGDLTKTVICATANPYKFNKAVLEAVQGPGAVKDQDEYKMLVDLHRVTGMSIHRAVKDLDKKPILHKSVIEKDALRDEIIKILGISS
jgi:threonine synthase